MNKYEEAIQSKFEGRYNEAFLIDICAEAPCPKCGIFYSTYKEGHQNCLTKGCKERLYVYKNKYEYTDVLNFAEIVNDDIIKIIRYKATAKEDGSLDISKEDLVQIDFKTKIYDVFCTLGNEDYLNSRLERISVNNSRRNANIQKLYKFHHTKTISLIIDDLKNGQGFKGVDLFLRLVDEDEDDNIFF